MTNWAGDRIVNKEGTQDSEFSEMDGDGNAVAGVDHDLAARVRACARAGAGVHVRAV